MVLLGECVDRRLDGLCQPFVKVRRWKGPKNHLKGPLQFPTDDFVANLELARNIVVESGRSVRNSLYTLACHQHGMDKGTF